MQCVLHAPTLCWACHAGQRRLYHPKIYVRAMWLEKTARDAYQAERAGSLGRPRSCLTLRSSVAARRDRSALVPAQGNDPAD